MTSVWVVTATVLAAFICKGILDIWRELKTLQSPFPRRTIVFGPMNFLANHLLPRIPGITMGSGWAFDEKHEAYQRHGLDVQLTISFWPKVMAAFQIVDPAIVKEMASARTRFVKPTEKYGALSIFGPNIITSEGAEWKKHRKVCAPAFSEPNNRLVWNETVRICQELYLEVWQGRDQIEFDHVVTGFSLPIALLVLGAASFGRRVSWKDDELAGEGKRYSFKEALHIASLNIALKTALPKWAFKLTARLQSIQEAFDDLSVYMSEMIQERRSSQNVDKHDLFSNLLASSVEEGEGTFTEEDIMGDIFIFTLAGHETTAHALAFTLGLLALYPDEQEALYQHIISVVPPGQTPTYEDMGRLPRVLATYYESMRLYPPVMQIPKRCTEDTQFTTFNQAREPVQVFVPEGSQVVFPVAGIHYNERYWDQPYEFRPDRFLQDWPRDAFIPFSSGPRACLGRRFFETEGVAILTTLIARYKVSIKEELQFAHETFEERKARVLKGRVQVSFAPVRLPVTFTRRNSK